MKHYYNKNGDTKKQRGFYVDDQVTRIKIEVLDTMDNNRYLLKPYIAYEYEDTYLDQINKLKQNPLYDIEHDVNSFSFKTNFTEDKFVVLQIPYDKGWSLKANQENVDIYKGQGGFVSFLAKKGETQYYLEYKTPLLSEGIKIMALGTALLSAYYMGLYNYNLSKKKFLESFKVN